MKTKLTSILTALAILSSFATTSLIAQSAAKPKPFLIQGQLPHLTGMVKIMWDDEDLALSVAQKEKLMVVRKNTLKNAQALGKEVNALEAEIVKASNDGATPASLKDRVSKLASLRAAATMVHLNCIFDTRAILSDDQLYVLE
ncbi:hypothetical protein GJV85_08005 [Sulfurimonas aquatica]|uniref:Uncharacterized protein n=1 Tax=Sulfurimonas aquatica TaxID=2672570 RepID=A0A975B0T7_9BACT|nr:hypothetical protein [Sulfurimonas aquatica]QSZ42055.1 hypothetical protein GJV85_08005 [Sulfurimonas aquatica]